MSVKRIIIKDEVSLGIPTNNVIRIIGDKILPGSTLSMTVASGAGVHLIYPMIPENSAVKINVQNRAHFTLSIFGIANDLSNNLNVSVNLIGDQAKTNIDLAFIGKGNNESNLMFDLNHLAANTSGRITSRRIQHDDSISVLKGMLMIHKTAHNTDTYLSDKAILIGKGSRAESDPQLEILADDVKASHGVTIGQLLPEELFYLRSRGIDEQEAQNMILAGFLKPALIGVPLKMTQKISYVL